MTNFEDIRRFAEWQTDRLINERDASVETYRAHLEVERAWSALEDAHRSADIALERAAAEGIGFEDLLAVLRDVRGYTNIKREELTQ